MTDLDKLLKSINQIDETLIGLLGDNTNLLNDANLDKIQNVINERKRLLEQISTEEITNFVQQQNKEWQELVHRTHKLIELATYHKDDIKEKIDKRGRGKRSIAVYQQLLN